MSVVRKYLESKYSRTPDVGSEMTDGDSSDLTFCEVGSAENDGQFGSPKAIPVDSMIFARTAKINKVEPNGSDKDMPGSRISALTQDYNIKGPVTQAFIGAESNVLYQAKPSLKKPAQANVSFEKGYSQMDWLKLRDTQHDLSGFEGQSKQRSISLKEVEQHKSGESIWIVLKGCVYNIAPYMKFHPGGVDMLMEAAGKDCTALFNQYHAWVNAEFLLEKCYIGSLPPHECMYTIEDTMSPDLLCTLSPSDFFEMDWRGSHPYRDLLKKSATSYKGNKKNRTKATTLQNLRKQGKR